LGGDGSWMVCARQLVCLYLNRTTKLYNNYNIRGTVYFYLNSLGLDVGASVKSKFKRLYKFML